MFNLVQAQPAHAQLCYEIIDAGRAYQRSLGFTQWSDTYPNLQTIQDDISHHRGYCLLHADALTGYVALMFSDEPCYHDPRATWHHNLPYATIHRFALASSVRGKHLATPALDAISTYCRARGFSYVRVDTGLSNLPMQHALERAGFMPAGMVDVHGDRLAYDKLIGPSDQ